MSINKLQLCSLTSVLQNHCYLEVVEIVFSEPWMARSLWSYYLEE